jgi:hypothetical protein
VISPKRPLPARLFLSPRRERVLLKTFLWLISGYVFCAAVITYFQATLPPPTGDVMQAGFLPPPLDGVRFSGVDQGPAQRGAVVPDFAPFEAFPEYRPWVGLPGWKEAQINLPAYQSWLEQQHPGYKVELVDAMVTAYTPHATSCGDSADGKTATMADAWGRGIAVPKTLLWCWRMAGVKVHVPGYMWQSMPGQAWRPDDCGSALLRTWKAGKLHIDVRFQNEAWARQWGVRRGWVMLLRPREEN